MNAKEKAQKLIDKYCSKHWEQKNGSIIIDLVTSKQCALICVDEIIIELKATAFNYDLEDLPLRYWQEVKVEIEKL